MKAHQKLGKKLKAAGPLDDKTGQLIKLAAAAASRSEGAVHSHIKRALKAGAKPDEVYHALLLLVSTVGFPTIAAALSWARDYIEKQGGRE
jgi:AhpD family alkylhydroperoxidase